MSVIAFLRRLESFAGIMYVALVVSRLISLSAAVRKERQEGSST